MSEGRTQSDDELIEAVRSRGYFVTPNANRYDRKDTVQLVSSMIAGPIKFGVYRVRDPENGEWSKLQFHLTYNNTVMAVMEEESARLFIRLASNALDFQAPNPHPTEPGNGSVR